MAITNLVPTTPTIQTQQGLQQQVNFVCQSSVPAAVDMATWASFNLNIFVPGGSGIASPLLTKATGFTGTSGNLAMLLTTADTTALPPGQYQYAVSGIAVVASDPQLVGSGSILIKAAA